MTKKAKANEEKKNRNKEDIEMQQKVRILRNQEKKYKIEETKFDRIFVPQDIKVKQKK